MRTATPLYKGLAVLGCVIWAAACRNEPVGVAPEMRPAYEVGSQGGNSNAAHLCQKDGYLSLFRADGTPFLNEGDCTSYGASGGKFMRFRTIVFSGITMGACNSITFGYTVDGVAYDVYTMPGGCGPFQSFPDYTAQVLPTSTVEVYLKDNTCGSAVFTQSGAHALVTGSNPYQIAITDAGGYCESTSNSSPRPPTNGLGNLNVTETIQ